MPHDPTPEEPAVKPEIIPPGRGPTRPSGHRPDVWISISTRGGPARLSFSVMLLAALGALLLAAIVVVLVSATLVLIPVVAALLGVLLLAGLLSGYVRGRRHGPRV